MSLSISPGKKIFYTKDNVKHYGYVILADENLSKYRISLAGSGDTLEVDEGEVEEAPGSG